VTAWNPSKRLRGGAWHSLAGEPPPGRRPMRRATPVSRPQQCLKHLVDGATADAAEALPGNPALLIDHERRRCAGDAVAVRQAVAGIEQHLLGRSAVSISVRVCSAPVIVGKLAAWHPPSLVFHRSVGAESLNEGQK
jgi:hypothetical protein